MRTVGQILKEEREAKYYTIENIEKATKIRKELLEALEDDNYQKLPPPTFVQGFIKSYSKFLGLDSNKLLAVFRREYSDRKNPPRILDSFANPLTPGRFNLTPTKVLSVLVIGLIAAFFIYLWFEYRYLIGAPTLDVAKPSDQFSTNSATVEIAGKTDPEVKVAINNQEVEVSNSGQFSQTVNLSESVNKITITATSKLGQTAKIERTVFLKK